MEQILQPDDNVVVAGSVAAKEMHGVPEEDACYYNCGKTPCEWLKFGVIALESIKEKINTELSATGFVIEKNSGESISNNRICFSFYKMFSYEKFGHLGHGNRIKIRKCVEDKVKEYFPDLDGEYTGFSVEHIQLML
jgi:hypothetical protein